MKFLARLAESSQQNKMTAANLAIVIAPSLLWPKPDTVNDGLLTNSGLARPAHHSLISIHHSIVYYAKVGHKLLKEHTNT